MQSQMRKEIRTCVNTALHMYTWWRFLLLLIIFIDVLSFYTDISPNAAPYSQKAWIAAWFEHSALLHIS